jgi:hypothetical protein
MGAASLSVHNIGEASVTRGPWWLHRTSASLPGAISCCDKIRGNHGIDGNTVPACAAFIVLSLQMVRGWWAQH